MSRNGGFYRLAGNGFPKAETQAGGGNDHLPRLTRHFSRGWSKATASLSGVLNSFVHDAPSLAGRDSDQPSEE